MGLLIQDELLSERLIAERVANGHDRYDEVWDGVYVMSPIADNQHQSLASTITSVIQNCFDWRGFGLTLAGANVSDRQTGWAKNYRVPDVLSFAKDTSAVDCGTHWFGGPDLAIEIVSRGDRTLEKLGFYADVKTSELLVIDRDPWKLTLYRLADSGTLQPAAVCSFDQPSVIKSRVVPVRFELLFGERVLRMTDESGEVIRDAGFD